MADAAASGHTKSGHGLWMWGLMLIPALAMLPPGGTVLSLGWNMLTHMFGPLFTNPGLVLGNAVNVVSNTFNAVASPLGWMTLPTIPVDPVSSTGMAMSGHAGMTMGSGHAAHTMTAPSASDAFAQCKASIAPDDLTNIQTLAQGDGVSLDQYLKNSGLCEHAGHAMAMN